MQLYVISDSILTPYNKICSMLELAIESGIDIFQFRDKQKSDNEILPLVLDLAKICNENDILFILNDRLNLALNLQDMGINCGIHLGKDDLNISFKTIRKKFKGTIGISCYGNINRALNYESLGADYVAFGSIFQSPTKKDSKVIGFEILKEAKERLRIPICAIGGINANNVSKVKNADFIALISSIWKGDIKKNIIKLKEFIK